jgi:hypothetical protein
MSSKIPSQLKKFDKKQARMGMDVEKEHQDVTHGDTQMTAKIAAAHLREDPKYYSKLKKVEEGFPRFEKLYRTIMEYEERYNDEPIPELPADVKKIPWEVTKKYTPLIKELGKLDQTSALEKLKTVPDQIKQIMAHSLGLSISAFTQFRNGQNEFHRMAKRFYTNTLL